MNAPKFNIETGAMSVFTKDVDGTPRRFIRAVASSSVKDLHGDEIVADAIQDMARQASGSDMTIFLNHKYEVPEDVFGTTTMARAVSKGTDSDGSPIWEMEIETMLDDSNPRAEQTYKALQGGVKLGVSIGALIEDWEPIDEKAGPWGGLRIKSLKLLEASIVGIPANPRSWVQRGVAALKSYIKDEDARKTIELIEASAEALPMTIVNGAYTVPITLSVDGAESSTQTIDVITQAPEPEPTETDDALPTVNDEVEPDVTASAETSDDPEPEPPTDDEEPAPESDSAPLAPGLAVSGVDLLVASYKAKLQEKDEQISALEKERDDLTQQLGVATAIVEKIATLPLGKKTSFKYQVSAYRQNLAGIYSEDFMKFLERNPE